MKARQPRTTETGPRTAAASNGLQGRGRCEDGDDHEKTVGKTWASGMAMVKDSEERGHHHHDGCHPQHPQPLLRALAMLVGWKQGQGCG